MKITFLGTRGYIDIKSRRHRRHTSTLIGYKNTHIVLDCGIDWNKKIWEVKADAIIITHGHPDHAEGLKNGAPCPVYATKITWEKILRRYPIRERFTVIPRKQIRIGGILLEAFEVIHSLRAPAVGYRIQAGKARIWYVPDVVQIPDKKQALKDINLYIGDGASITRPIIRTKGKTRIGHSSIREQLKWCAEEGVPKAVFTHCGTEIVSGGHKILKQKIHEMGKSFKVEAGIAHDGMELIL